MVESILTSVEFEISLLLFIALAGYLIASRFNQSAVVGAIVLGLIAGPSFLGLIHYEGFVEGMARFGVIVLLFVIGLEFKLKDVFNTRYGLIALAGKRCLHRHCAYCDKHCNHSKCPERDGKVADRDR